MLTSQNNSRAATPSINSDILGEVRWYDATTEQFGEVTINGPQCTIGSNPGCTICLPTQGVADIHATLVFGRRFILLKAPFPTQIAGRHIRESLIDKLTELTIGSVHLEIVPRHELGKKTKRPRVIRSQELVDAASSLSHRTATFEPAAFAPLREISNDSAPPSSTSPIQQTRDGIDAIASTEVEIEQKAKSEERFSAIEVSLGKLQSAVEIIQSQGLTPTPAIPVDFSQQIAAMGKSVAEELEQRLAIRLDTQAASQASLVNQIRDEALRPIESTLEGLLSKIDYLSTQQIQTTDQLGALAASTDFRLAEWDQWRESLLQSPEQDFGTQQHLPQDFRSTEVGFVDSEMHAPLPTNYPSQYYSHDDSNQVSEDAGVESPHFQENDADNTESGYSEESFYNQNGFDSHLDTESQFSSQQHEYENRGEHDPSAPTSELHPWGESAPDVPMASGTAQESYPYAEPYDSEIVDNITSAYSERIPSEGYSSEGYSSEGYSSEGNGAYSTDYDSQDEIPILTTLENQAPRYDSNSDIAAEEDQPYGLPMNDRSSESFNNDAIDSSNIAQDIRNESPLAAYLKSPLTELPSKIGDPAPNSYSSNLDSFLATPEPREESTNVPNILRNTPYAIPEESHETYDESRERDVLPEPTNELSIRLRQMLAEIKAEEEKSNVMDESESYDNQEIISATQESGEEEQVTPPSWLRNYALSDSQHDEEPTTETYNDSMETDEYVDSHFDRSESSMVALDPDSTSTLDAPPELPRFDWNKGSLLSSDNDTQSSLLSTIEIEDEEDQSQIDDDQPSPSHSTGGVVLTDNIKEDKEESIEEYMQKLLQRVKQGSDGAETPLEDLTVRSAPRSRREFLNRSIKTPEPDDVQQEPLKNGEPVPESPKRPSPTQVDMDALRELANSNARRAIARSETKRANTTVLIKVAITAFAVAAAALILLLNGFNMNPPFAGFVAALVVAFLWGTDCYKHFKSLKDSKPSNLDTVDQSIPDDNAVRTDEDADSSWRPSPI